MYILTAAEDARFHLARSFVLSGKSRHNCEEESLDLQEWSSANAKYEKEDFRYKREKAPPPLQPHTTPKMYIS